MTQSIALKIFSIRPTSASTERMWSSFSFIHSKSRNRLTIDNSKKLTFLFCFYKFQQKKTLKGVQQVNNEDSEGLIWDFENDPVTG